MRFALALPKLRFIHTTFVVQGTSMKLACDAATRLTLALTRTRTLTPTLALTLTLTSTHPDSPINNMLHMHQQI